MYYRVATSFLISLQQNIHVVNQSFKHKGTVRTEYAVESFVIKDFDSFKFSVRTCLSIYKYNEHYYPLKESLLVVEWLTGIHPLW